jgi:hypothetical protein
MVFVKGVDFSSRAPRAQRKDGSESAGGNNEWRVRKPAPLNTIRVRHPTLKSAQKRDRACDLKKAWLLAK